MCSSKLGTLSSLRGYRIAVIISVFQTDDEGSTPSTRSTKRRHLSPAFCFIVKHSTAFISVILVSLLIHLDMNTNEKVMWVLRLGVAGEFLGHGALALQGKAQWTGWIVQMLGVEADVASNLLSLIGLFDILTAIIVLLAPIPAFVLWAAIWGFWTALLRPLVGESGWDFIERFANWAAPLALLIMMGIPKKTKDWFRIAK
jgi:hypothetical protein